jgi:uncharacterized protein (DUF58 family)
MATLAALLVGGLLPPDGYTPLVLMALTLCLWFFAEWAWFLFRAHAAERHLTLYREIHDDRGPVEHLWAGRTFRVRLELGLTGSRALPYLIFRDRLPTGLEHREGKTGGEIALASGGRSVHEYRVHCPNAGQVRFEGVSLRLTDFQGFFLHRAFLRSVVVYRVLPALADAEGRTPVSKRHNLLPPPGVHRHRQPGSGSELLELRDYLPGDPPKMIAWKVSARRDRLITKQFESEVPVRCTLFVDASHSVRLGPAGQNALARLVEIAAAVAQAANGNRDPVGLGLFDEQEVRYLRPVVGHRHLTEILRRLSDAAALAPVSGDAPLYDLLPLAHEFAREVYPDVMRSEVNAFPPWLGWFKPPSIWTIRHLRFADVAYSLMPWLVTLPITLPMAFLFLTGYEITLTLAGAPSWHSRLVFSFWRPMLQEPSIPRLLFYSFLFLLYGSVAFFYLLMLYVIFRSQRIAYRMRKELAALFSVRFGMEPGGLGLLLEDDIQFCLAAQRFLAEHQVPYPYRLYDSQGHYLFASAGKVDVLAGALLRAVGRGRDNELFVLMVDLLEVPDRLPPLLKAVKVALARHHQVIVICPWPPDMAAPSADKPTRALGPAPTTLEAVDWAMTGRFHEAFHQLRQTFARLGVPILCARDGDPARLIVERLDRLRTVRAAPGR